MGTVIGREVDLSGYGGEEDPFRISVMATHSSTLADGQQLGVGLLPKPAGPQEDLRPSL